MIEDNPTIGVVDGCWPLQSGCSLPKPCYPRRLATIPRIRRLKTCVSAKLDRRLPVCWFLKRRPALPSAD